MSRAPAGEHVEELARHPRMWRDAVELARATRGDQDGALAALRSTSPARPDAKTIATAVLTTDAFRILALHRAREAARAAHVPLANHVLRMMQTAIFGLEIGRDVTIGYGVYFVHTHGIVIGGDARIGDRVRFYGSNTIGTAKDNGYPTLEEDVWVGAGARILGPIRIGARARIGANAVVLADVPADSVAVGIPARVVTRD